MEESKSSALPLGDIPMGDRRVSSVYAGYQGTLAGGHLMHDGGEDCSPQKRLPEPMEFQVTRAAAEPWPRAIAKLGHHSR